MKIVLVYDEPAGPGFDKALPEDYGAEYEDQRTVRALLEAMTVCGHEAVALSLGKDFPGRIDQHAPDLVFNIAEGVRGAARESIVPAWLDFLGIPYTGSDGLTLAVSLDKALTKTLLSARGFRTPEFKLIRRGMDLAGIDLPFPLFVKPNAEGSSMGIRKKSKVQNLQELETQVNWVIRNYKQACLVEVFAPGREFCIGLLGNDRPELLPIVEVRTKGEFYSYEYKEGHQKELICPAELPGELCEQMHEMALTAFETLRCRDLARVDFKLDETGQPCFLEINPLPGLSPFYSIFPYQAKSTGIEFEELIGRIIDAAVKRISDIEERAMT